MVGAAKRVSVTDLPGIGLQVVALQDRRVRVSAAFEGKLVHENTVDPDKLPQELMKVSSIIMSRIGNIFAANLEAPLLGMLRSFTK